MDRIFVRIDPILVDEDRQKIEEMVNKNQSEQVIEYLQAKIPNLEAISAEEAAKYIQELKIQMQTIMSQLDKIGE